MDPQSGTSPDQILGQTVGNYLVTQKLGEGGMGSVYLAEHPTIGKKVALKVLHAEFSNNPEVAERFFTEAKSVNAIGHPNIVDIVDYGVLQTGPQGRDRLVYFIMEYLAGQTLSGIVRTQSPLAPERALTIALQVGDALAASHKSGIVHRDLKPDNIILINRGRESDFVKLLDFGIAKLTGNDGMSSHKTRTGLVLGTPAYMSPEQCEGRATVDHRTDIYALGVVLYEMLVGRVPFIGEGYGEILVQHLTQQPIPPSQYRMMSPHVEQVVLKALEKRPEMRYPTMDEFMRAMSDPVGFVESHGGLTGFAQKQLMPSNAPLPPVRLTPSPTSTTPIPGLLSPAPGTLTANVGVGPSPTTLSAAAGQAVPAGKSKTPFIIAGAFTLIAAAVGVFFVLKKKGGDDKPVVAAGSNDGSDGSANVVKMDGSGSAAVVTPPTPNTGSAVTPVPDSGSGSATTNTGSAGSAAGTGSATPPENTGSGTTTPPDNKGSGATTPPTNGSAATVVQNTTVKVTSNPPGADILVNGAAIGKKTPADLELPRGKDTKITVRMKGMADVVRRFKLGADPVNVDAVMKPPVAGKGSGSGKGSGKTCDTCLERPD